MRHTLRLCFFSRFLRFPIDIIECPCVAWSNSGFDIGRGFATRAGRVDVGARARQLQARRLWTIALSGTAVAGFVIVVLNTFQENLMYYITPSQVWAYISRQITLIRRSLECIKSSVHCLLISVSERVWNIMCPSLEVVERGATGEDVAVDDVYCFTDKCNLSDKGVRVLL